MRKKIEISTKNENLSTSYITAIKQMEREKTKKIKTTTEKKKKLKKAIHFSSKSKPVNEEL